jgi:hypothetical protein
MPHGAQWVHEIKHDGYRLIVRRDGDRVRLYTRRGFFPLIAEAVMRLRVRSAIIDGEAVVCDDSGLSNFDKLHSSADSCVLALLERPIRNLRAAGLAGFLTLIQHCDRPERYGKSRRFETMPSSPIKQACLKMMAPSPARCSLK